MILHLEQQPRDQNRFRFYALDVCQDLFSAWCLCRRWGRIGTNGLTRSVSYGSAAAVGAATALSQRKQRWGYALLAEQLELPLWD